MNGKDALAFLIRPGIFIALFRRSVCAYVPALCYGMAMLDDLLQFVPPHLQKDYMRLMQRVPFYLRNFGMVGKSGPALGYLLKKRAGIRASGLVSEGAALPLTEKMLDAAYLLQGDGADIPFAEFDALVLSNLETDFEDPLATLEEIAPRLALNCHVFALFAAPSGAEGMEHLRSNLMARLHGLGFEEAQQWSLEDDGQVVGCLCMFVSRDYDAAAHAQVLLRDGLPDRAYELIEMVPRDESVPFERRAQLHWERLCILTTWLEQDPDLEPTVRLMAAQESFYFVVFALPHESAAYQAMARCWHAMGDDDMALRLLRSIQMVSPDRAVEALLDGRTAGRGAVTATPRVDAPWQEGPPLRVLFLMNPRPHYGIDVLFDGLCAVLGDEQVVDYPYKPWLHGEDTEQLAHYPCRFQRRGRALSIEAVLSELKAGEFDLILYADVEGDVPRAEMVAIMQHAGTCPVAIVDALDEFSDFRGRVAEHLNFNQFAAYFKREKLRGVDYGPDAYPLPFAYDGNKAIPTWESDRGHPFFWAGHRMFGKRRLYLEAVESHFGWDLNATYAPDDYIDRIRNSRVGLNCFGMGFDTVRFWELPAHGCMLLSERLPIEIPCAFEEGKHAAYFDDLPGLIAQVDHYEAHPEVALEVARAGHAHFLAHHSNEARARQLLGWLRTKLVPSPA